jgi:hypothetical protein
MKNKTFFLSFLVLLSIAFASCAGSRTGYGNHRKGYGCPATASIQNGPIDKNKI